MVCYATTMKIFGKTDNKKPVSILGKWAKQKTGRCWAPSLDCENAPIRAHSMQNARILESIQEDGHVIGIEVFLKSGELHVGFRKIGRNKATTFLGLCSHHDTEIFSHLDQNLLDLNDDKTCLLLTWRAITHEMAEKMEQGVKFQSEYQVTPTIFSNQKRRLLFKRYVIKGTGALLATSSFFVVQGHLNREPSYISVNAFPINGDTMVLFTILRKDLGVVMPIIRSLLVKRELCPIRFSAFILSRVQNFVLSPSHFSQWSAEKVNAIEKAFASSGMDSDWLEPKEIYNLF